MSVIDMIATSQSIYSDADPGWRSFVLDHKALIKANSVNHSVSPDIMGLCEYNVRAYLRYINASIDYEWVIRLINDIPNDVAFSLVSHMLIPRDTYMKTLFDSYRTTEAIQT